MTLFPFGLKLQCNAYKYQMSCLVTKPTMWLCAQRRLRSAWASAQADQSLCWAHTHFVGFVTRWLKLLNFGNHITAMKKVLTRRNTYMDIWVISGRRKYEHEGLFAMKRRFGSEKISASAGFELETPWSEVVNIAQPRGGFVRTNIEYSPLNDWQ